MLVYQRVPSTFSHPSCMSSIPLGVVHRHALGDITAKVELRSVQVPHGHLPSHVLAETGCGWGWFT